jgi:hypothetical protein
MFDVDVLGLSGRTLHAVCRNPHDPDHVSDGLLHWHFEQAVLANMRGPGEAIFDHDFPPGSDIMGSILDTPDAAARMEFELSTRLYDTSRKQNSFQVPQT